MITVMNLSVFENEFSHLSGFWKWIQSWTCLPLKMNSVLNLSAVEKKIIQKLIFLEIELISCQEKAKRIQTSFGGFFVLPCARIDPNFLRLRRRRSRWTCSLFESGRRLKTCMRERLRLRVFLPCLMDVYQPHLLNFVSPENEKKVYLCNGKHQPSVFV